MFNIAENVRSLKSSLFNIAEYVRSLTSSLFDIAQYVLSLKSYLFNIAEYVLSLKSSLFNIAPNVLSFQIRVKVLEGRQIEGSNIQPVCKVGCFNQVKQTRVKKSTNSPFWNETFFFNFNAAPAELFDEMLEFTVYNSKKLRSDAMIGSFKVKGLFDWSSDWD